MCVDLSLGVQAVDQKGAATVVIADDGSFVEFARARTERYLDLAWLITRDAEDARDAVQDALAGLYARWSRLPTDDELEAYAYRTVVNACLRVVRRRPRSLPVAQPEGLPLAPVGADPADAVAAADEVWRLCGELSADQRTAVVLRFYQELSFAEIATVLGCRESTARSHVHRAVVALRTRVEGRQ